MSFPIWATSPLLYALVLLVLLLAGWHWLPASVRYTCVAIEVLLVASMTPLAATALTRAIAMRAAPARVCPAPRPDTIVVLGAGFDYAPSSPDDYAAIHQAGLQRLFTGVELWRKLPDARLVIAGGAGWQIREAVPMAHLAMQMGVPQKSIEIETHSRNTWQNARNVAALSPAVPKRIWLVTSAVHMPRALGAFRAWGFKPCAWPSGLPETRLHAWPGAFVPQGSGASMTGIALHELTGGVAYAIREWAHARHPSANADHTP